MLTKHRAVGAGAAACALGVVLASGGSAAADTLTAHPLAAAQTVPQRARSLELAPLRQISTAAAWQVTKGAGVAVGVLDTGADGTVPDLTGSVTIGPDYTAGADPAGYQPPHLHGTYISSLIAGHGSGPGDSEGVLGVAPQARVLSVRVILDDNEPGLSVFGSSARFENSVANGIHYAVAHGVKVINMSLGGNDPNRTLRTAIQYAISHNVVVVASAGNSGTKGSSYTAYDYPASFTGVISVAAVDGNGHRASFSDQNASVVLSAPGVDIVAAGPNDEYIDGSGTSPAAAFVSGVAALIRSKYPGLSPALVEQALVASTTHRPAGGYSPSVGFGEVNAAGALRAAAQLARTTAATGLPSAARFGPAQLGAIQVTHRDEARIRGYAAGAGVALLGFLVALVLLVITARRAVRGRRAAATAVPGWPVPAGAGWSPSQVGFQPAAPPAGTAAVMPTSATMSSPAAVPPPSAWAPPPPAAVPPPPAAAPPPPTAYPQTLAARHPRQVPSEGTVPRATFQTFRTLRAAQSGYIAHLLASTFDKSRWPPGVARNWLADRQLSGRYLALGATMSGADPKVSHNLLLGQQIVGHFQRARGHTCVKRPTRGSMTAIRAGYLQYRYIYFLADAEP